MFMCAKCRRTFLFSWFGLEVYLVCHFARLDVYTFLRRCLYHDLVQEGQGWVGNAVDSLFISQAAYTHRDRGHVYSILFPKPQARDCRHSVSSGKYWAALPVIRRFRLYPTPDEARKPDRQPDVQQLKRSPGRARWLGRIEVGLEGVRAVNKQIVRRAPVE